MRIELIRIYKGYDYTIGKLFIDGKYQCDTLEDKDRGLRSDMSLTEIKAKKVYGKTAIPTGTYQIKLTPSTRFQRIMPEILDVPGFSGIRIHSGNTSADTEGCLLVGQNKAKGKVLCSRSTFEKLFANKLYPASCSGEDITISIR